MVHVRGLAAKGSTASLLLFWHHRSWSYPAALGVYLPVDYCGIPQRNYISSLHEQQQNNTLCHVRQRGIDLQPHRDAARYLTAPTYMQLLTSRRPNPVR